MPGLERPRQPAGEGSAELPLRRTRSSTGPPPTLPALPWLAGRVRRAPGGPRRAAPGTGGRRRCAQARTWNRWAVKFGQVGIANLRLSAWTATSGSRTGAHKVASAPQLFARAPVVLDLSHHRPCPMDAVRELLGTIRGAGLLPGLATAPAPPKPRARAGPAPLRQVPRRLRAQRRYPWWNCRRRHPAARSRAPSLALPRTLPGQVHDKPVRSGQQVMPGAATRAHRHGGQWRGGDRRWIDPRLRQPARESHRGRPGRRRCAHLLPGISRPNVSIAGHYRVFEDIPAELRGGPVQAWLEGEKLLLARL